MIPGLGRLPWRRKWLPTPTFQPREFHGQRSLAGYSLWGRKESDTTEQLSLHWLAGIFKHIIFISLNKDTLSVFCDTYKGSLVSGFLFHIKNSYIYLKVVKLLFLRDKMGGLAHAQVHTYPHM